MNELSKERLENYASGSWYPDADYVKAMARELLALRERAEPVCPKCQGTGLADSGGFHPWGEPIEVDCDCRAAMLATAPGKEG
ncbi:hypothetical protein SMY41_002345 [Cronobacter sakazakii]|nr:hypothetical protein [Cronobacter sakazakii]KAB0871690.1 hypothetical protein FZI03_11970 [Cronobacter sakazakii]